MASDTVTRRAEAEADRPRRFRGSSLSRTILALNLLALAVLVIGSLVLNEFRQGLIQSKQDSLRQNAELLAEVIAATATRGEPLAQMEQNAPVVLQRFVPSGSRARLFTPDGRLLTDSYLVSIDVDVRPLPPARPRGAAPPSQPPAEQEERRRSRAQLDLRREITAAAAGLTVSQVRPSEAGERVVSVSVPIRRVTTVLGVLTVEQGDLDEVVTAQRLALAPFIIIAVLVTLASSLLLQFFVARPVLKLATAADRVRLSRARAIELPELSERRDELGALSRSLRDMTEALSTRIDAIESFAADVAHEIRNPLASIGSAVETLDLVKDDAARARLLAILKQDVRRLDRLVTDIANASRLDAELSREAPRPVDLARLLEELVSLYEGRDGGGVELRMPDGAPHAAGREGPLGQVFRNLIDNALSFSPPDRPVVVGVSGGERAVRVTVEDEGPGVPAENLETVFQRFYTSRPKGQAFGGNSGLGLSIARQIVEAHHGRVWAENRTDGDGRVFGARFTVELPAARP